MNIKRNITKMLFADTLPAELIMAVFAITQGWSKLSVPADKTLATVVISTGSIRIVALLFGLTWLRLAISYAAVFSWIYFIMFVFLQEPSPHLPSGLVSALANVWIAWRLQSDQHVRKDLIINGR